MSRLLTRRNRPWRQLLTVVVLLLFLTVAGTVGLKLLTPAGTSWIDCLYMSVITLTTVGYGETVELGTRGRVFIIIYLVLGLGVFTYSASLLGQWIVNVRLQGLSGTTSHGKSNSKTVGPFHHLRLGPDGVDHRGEHARTPGAVRHRGPRRRTPR